MCDVGLFNLKTKPILLTFNPYFTIVGRGLVPANLKWHTIKSWSHVTSFYCLSERNQAARSNRSSSLCFHSHATVPHIVALLGFSFSRCKDRYS